MDIFDSKTRVLLFIAVCYLKTVYFQFGLADRSMWRFEVEVLDGDRQTAGSGNGVGRRDNQTQTTKWRHGESRWRGMANKSLSELGKGTFMYRHTQVRRRRIIVTWIETAEPGITLATGEPLQRCWVVSNLLEAKPHNNVPKYARR